jgi:hypothetical protein
MKWIFVFIFVLFPHFTYAIDLEKNCRVANQPPGYCAWASLETLGNKHQIEPLYNLVETRKTEPDFILEKIKDGKSIQVIQAKNEACDLSIEDKLKQLNIKYKFQATGNKDIKILIENVNEFGCMIGVKKGARGPAAHCIVLTKINDKEVEFYDCNQPNSLWIGSREWLDFHWTGLAVVVEK